jgi:AraC-like DNA-binding protein
MPFAGLTTDAAHLQNLLEGFDVRILAAQVDRLSTGAWNHPSLADSYWRLYQNDAPGGRLDQPGLQTVLEPGQVYLIPSGLTLASRNDGPLCQFFIHFDPIGVSPVVLQILFPKPVLVPHSPVCTALAAEMGQRVQERGIRDPGVQCSVKGLVLDAFGRCLSDPSHNRIEESRHRVGVMHPILPAIRHIHDHLSGQITNADLASECHLSEDHFIRRFRQAVGQSPGQYVLRQRINRAAQLLLFTNDTIERIAAETGFSDRFYFSRVFTRESGLPPARYRRGPRV